MNYMIIDENGNVVNAIVLDNISQYTPPAGFQIIQSDIAGIGWVYINSVFSNPHIASVTLSASQLASAALSAGLQITSTSTPSLNGTYGLDQSAQNNVNATVTYILLNGTFPGGGTTMPWVDQNNEPHLWPNVTMFKSFATAYADFVAAVSLYQLSNGAAGAIPSNQVTIP
jgi:hypothetical protein